VLEHPVIIPGLKPSLVTGCEAFREELVQVEEMDAVSGIVRIIRFEQVRFHLGEWGRDFDLVVYPVWHSKKVRG